MKEWEEKIKRKDFIYRTNKYKYNFQQYETIRSFGETIYIGKISTDKAEMDQSNLLRNFKELLINLDQEHKKVKMKKRNTFQSVNALYEGREFIINAFKSEIFLIKFTQVKGLKRLTPKQMLQRSLMGSCLSKSR